MVTLLGEVRVMVSVGTAAALGPGSSTNTSAMPASRPIAHTAGTRITRKTGFLLKSRVKRTVAKTLTGSVPARVYQIGAERAMAASLRRHTAAGRQADRPGVPSPI